MYDFIADQSDAEVRYLEVPDEDHFFTRGIDHYRLFKQIFDFFARHMENQARTVFDGSRDYEDP